MKFLKGELISFDCCLWSCHIYSEENHAQQLSLPPREGLHLFEGTYCVKAHCLSDMTCDS